MISLRPLAFVIASLAQLVSAAPALAGMDTSSYDATVKACDMVRNSPDLSPAFSGAYRLAALSP
jgi:hypothetical protein